MITEKGYRLTVLLFTLSFIAGCSKAPTAAIEAAQTTLDEARAAGSTDYLADEDKAVNEKLNTALLEIETQESKMAPFRNYAAAEKLLVEAQDAGTKLQTATVQKKDQTKNDAVALHKAAGDAVLTAKTLLEQAPQGKGTEADLAALHADLSAVEESLPTVQQAIDNGDYLGAVSKARPLQEKADAVSNEVQQAIEKIRLVESQKQQLKAKMASPAKKKKG